MLAREAYEFHPVGLMRMLLKQVVSDANSFGVVDREINVFET